MQGARQIVRARWAVSAAFFANGFVVGHWAIKVPILVQRLRISDIVFGQMIILFGIGAVVSLVIGAALVGRFGSDLILRASMVAMAPALLFVSLASTPLSAALGMLWLGMFVAIMDNAMNANGVGVEVVIARPVMSSYHGFWSLGGVAGGLMGGTMVTWLGDVGHSIVIACVVLLIAFWTWGRFLPDAPHIETAENKGLGQTLSAIMRAPGILLLGLMMMLAFAPEGTVIDWSALYLEREHSAPQIASGYAVAAFSSTMAIMRFAGDGIRARFGDSLVFLGSVAAGASGLYVASAGQGLAIVCAGFFIAGLGMANMVPIMFSAAGRYPALTPSSGIAVVAVFGYSGLLFIPALVGLVADAYSLGFVFMGWSAILLVLTTLSGVFHFFYRPAA